MVYNSADDFIKTAKNIVANHRYLYGAKGEVITDELINRLAAENPRIYTNTYINKARKLKGCLGLDCSGLIYKTGVCDIIGSWDMQHRFKNVSISDVKPGYIVYKRGHVAICSKVIDDSKIEVVEMRGIDYYNSIRVTNKSEWLCALVTPNVNFTTNGKYTTGWHIEGGKWWYADTENTYFKNCVKRIKWSGGQDYFVFDKDGYCITNGVAIIKTDKSGVIYDVEGV